MEISLHLIIITVLGLAFFALTIYALAWSTRKGQMKNFEDQARSIFSEAEPEGVQTDFFPNISKQVLPPRSPSKNQ